MKLAIATLVGAMMIPAVANAGGRHDGGHDRGGFSVSVGIGYSDRGFSGGTWGNYSRGYYSNFRHDRYYPPVYYSAPVIYRAPVYCPPPVVYTQPSVVYTQPVYAQPVYAQPIYTTPPIVTAPYSPPVYYPQPTTGGYYYNSTTTVYGR